MLFPEAVSCVTTCFALLVKCVNDTTVLRRENHAVGTVRSWGQLGNAQCGDGALAEDSRYGD
jgi:hypothetical protein